VDPYATVAGEGALGAPANPAAAAPAGAPAPAAASPAEEPDKVSMALAIVGLLVVIGMVVVVTLMKVD